MSISIRISQPLITFYWRSCNICQPNLSLSASLFSNCKGATIRYWWAHLRAYRTQSHSTWAFRCPLLRGMLVEPSSTAICPSCSKPYTVPCPSHTVNGWWWICPFFRKAAFWGQPRTPPLSAPSTSPAPPLTSLDTRQILHPRFLSRPRNGQHSPKTCQIACLLPHILPP